MGYTKKKHLDFLKVVMLTFNLECRKVGVCNTQPHFSQCKPSVSSCSVMCGTLIQTCHQFQPLLTSCIHMYSIYHMLFISPVAVSFTMYWGVSISIHFPWRRNPCWPGRTSEDIITYFLAISSCERGGRLQQALKLFEASCRQVLSKFVESTWQGAKMSKGAVFKIPIGWFLGIKMLIL